MYIVSANLNIHFLITPSQLYSCLLSLIRTIRSITAFLLALCRLKTMGFHRADDDG
jgi:hypothetical protein